MVYLINTMIIEISQLEDTKSLKELILIQMTQLSPPSQLNASTISVKEKLKGNFLPKLQILKVPTNPIQRRKPIVYKKLVNLSTKVQYGDRKMRIRKRLLKALYGIKDRILRTLLKIRNICNNLNGSQGKICLNPKILTRQPLEKIVQRLPAN